MKLKTLKDILSIKSEKDAHGHILTGQFQQVARKWIKELDKIHLAEIFDDKTKVTDNLIAKQIQNWIRHFFNLKK